MKDETLVFLAISSVFWGPVALVLIATIFQGIAEIIKAFRKQP